MDNKKILFFKIKYLCYRSNEVFIDELIPELEAHGYDVEVCDIIDKDDTDSILERYIGKEYAAIIDFNSLLPRATLENGKHYVDLINAPYINYIVDHPLFHQVSLREELNNYNVICIDDNHKRYIDTYYSHIRNTVVISIPGTKADTEVPFEQRRIGLLFPASYRSVQSVLEDIEEQSDDVKKQIMDIIELMKNDNSITFEEALRRYLDDNNVITDAIQFRQKMTDLHLVDVYLRYYYREQVVRSLTEAGVQVNVCGDHWNQFNFKGNGNLHIESDVPYLVCQQYFQNAKCVLNVSPIFKAGIHDRVPSSMINGAVSITDNSSMLYRLFEPDISVITYETTDKSINELGHKVSELMTDQEMLSGIAQKGYYEVSNKLNWRTQASKLVDFIKIIN